MTRKPWMCLNVSNGIHESAKKILVHSIFTNIGGEVVVNKEGKNEILGSPTDTAILEFGLSLGGDFQAERESTKVIRVELFNSTKKQMGVVLELPEGGVRAHCKGTSEIVLAACDKVINQNCEVTLDNELLSYLKSTIDTFAGEALRTLCLAYMDLEDGVFADTPIPSLGYTCIGIVGIKDLVRPCVKESVALCRSIGMTVHMVVVEVG
ncbi:putative P-type ATPase, cytoplasmic domain N [Helianthus annuus]|nr:putative P-type ATPase, cytoplasmic domain N [Helianthus annuus]KAJ0709329.1 putative P-type ATPase, cytoplasmic domain N [Helianthus annuus]KAJ0713203.1 putative P-type ATPase, cytoplasmic domain N [Helianthus annuus]KAJ0890530.1 putative P-type ATPase, cytoplasmic domain N [Helianthus annuus]KAJ0895269.1 putative P-type ATPase, cytoplasmic domain N [Helianthus annuus]